LHVHFGTNAEEAWPLAIALGIPMIVTLHGFDINTRPSWWESGRGGRRYRHYPAALRAMDAAGVGFIAVSDAIAEAAAAYGLRRSAIHKMPIGIDTARIRPGERPVVTRPRRILFVGRFVEKKGIDSLLAAFPEVRRRVPDAELKLVGSGRLRRSLRRQAGDAAITFAGRMTADAVLDEMRLARVLCAPGVRAANGDAEGLPTVILEAQACGLPVVASRSGGSAEGILDGVSGIAFAERDHCALVEALVRLLTDDAFAISAAAAARRFAETKLDMAIHTAALERFYDEVAVAHYGRAKG
jgi:glycosyltransferase involved in cell wall biosynthesis